MSWLTTEGGQILLTESGAKILIEGYTPVPYSGPLPLQTIIPSYPYQEYSDDPNIVAFFTAFNELAQSYLDWFNQTPLAVYTNSNVAGPLLDWTATGIYGIARPVFSSQSTKYVAGLNSLPVDVGALNGSEYFQSGTATIASDDYYKRVLTWWLYAGNGRYFNVELLRLKVARFLYGVGGTDVALAQAQSVQIQPQFLPSPPAPALSSRSGGTLASKSYGVWLSYVSPIGETLVGPPSTLTVALNYLLVVGTPPPVSGADNYNIYADLLSTNPAHFTAGLNSMPVNGFPVNGFSLNGTNQSWNPSDVSGLALSNSNLKTTRTAASGWGGVRALIGKSSGKWYWELVINVDSAGNPLIGVGNLSATLTNFLGSDANGWGYYSANGQKYNNGTATAYGASYTAGDIIGFALDMDGGTITFYKNGTSQGQAFSGLSGTLYPLVTLFNQNDAATAVFVESGWTYAAPSGYKAFDYGSSSKFGVSPPTRQNASPIPIGTNWTEPISGLVVGAPLPTANTSNKPGNFIIKVPAGTSSQFFKQAMGQGLLAFPFQFSATVVIA